MLEGTLSLVAVSVNSDNQIGLSLTVIICEYPLRYDYAALLKGG